jgi:hypothetical protein
MANTRVKVPRDVLIDKLEAERQTILDTHERRAGEVRRERASYAKQLIRALAEVRRLAQADPAMALEHVDRKHRGYEKEVASVVLHDLPAPPRSPGEPNTLKLDRMLAVLRAATDDTLSIAAEDEYARYL